MVMARSAAPASVEPVHEAIRAYTASENPSAFLAVSQGNSYFTLPDEPGVIVYRPAGGYLVQFAAPFAPDGSYERLLKAFLQHAADQGRKVVAVQLQGHDAPIYAAHGFTVNQIGSSYAVDLGGFTLAGTKYMQLRNKISRALRSGVEVREVPYESWAEEIAEIDRQWLPLKGEGKKQLEYLVGQCGGEMQRYRRLFMAFRGGEPIGYVLYSPVYGTRPGWMHDLSRRRPDSPPGVMEAANKQAVDTFIAEGAHWLHFGFTPFTTLRADWEQPGHSPGFAWFMRFLWENGKDVYPAATQLDYKMKWGQTLVVPEYGAFQGSHASVSAFIHIFRAANGV
jgi:lysylphosphatidylglycerol synthetase-like protein (DUF2156 family)